MHNIQRLCPPLATVIINSYRSLTDLFVDGEVLLSKRGTTQGDPLTMPMYALVYPFDKTSSKREYHHQSNKRVPTLDIRIQLTEFQCFLIYAA